MPPPDAIPRSTLALDVARSIVERAHALGLAPGAHLPEQALAAAFHVSRSPVRQALEALARRGLVEQRPNRGFFLVATGERLERARSALSRRTGDAPYERIAADRLAGRLPAQFKETDLVRRYDLSRAELAVLLARMAREGWVERKPGYGWRFLPVLTSSESHTLSYRFRAAIEPAALLEPTYRVDAAAFARLRAEQEALIDGRIREISSAELFQIGSKFHEGIVGCCGNPFFLEALQRVNRLRRLIEYRAMVETRRFVAQAREHLELLDLLEAGDRAAAAERLSRHLGNVHAVKASVLGAGRSGRAPQTGGHAGPAVRSVHF